MNMTWTERLHKRVERDGVSKLSLLFFIAKMMAAHIDAAAQAAQSKQSEEAAK